MDTFGKHPAHRGSTNRLPGLCFPVGFDQCGSWVCWRWTWRGVRLGTVFWAPSRRAVMSAESLPRPQLLPWPGGAAPFSCQPWMWLLISGPWPSSALLTPSQVTLVKVPLVACAGLAGGCGKHGTWGADLRKLPLSGLSRCPTLLTPPGPVPMSPFLPRPCCSFSLDSSLLPASSNVGGHLLLPFQSCGCPHSDGAEGSPCPSRRPSPRCSPS